MVGRGRHALRIRKSVVGLVFPGYLEISGCFDANA